jgi:hypothetical protein
MSQLKHGTRLMSITRYTPKYLWVYDPFGVGVFEALDIVLKPVNIGCGALQRNQKKCSKNS